MAVSDGISDNLALKIKEGYVFDCRGEEDLFSLLKKCGLGQGAKESEVVSCLIHEIQERWFESREGVFSKIDDIAVALFSFEG